MKYQPFETDSLALLRTALERLAQGFADLPSSASDAPDVAGMAGVLDSVAAGLRDNYPYFHPLYAGQMLKPPHPIARAAYELALWLNPNNHALDGGRASSAMEKEAVAEIATMLDWPIHLGHLTSGGTMANLEALWVAGQLQPDKVIVASTQAHYTHSRISRVLRLKFDSIDCDDRGRLDLNALERRLQTGEIGVVVATIGATATGAVDPLPDLLRLRDKHGFRIHADAAYGGYFRLADALAPGTREAFAALRHVDSVVIDPHKHGLQPYGCGCVLFADPAVGALYKHDSPYTYFTSGELHLGEISLECSRPGAAAVALWATQRLLPLVRGGEFAGMLGAGREAALELYRRLQSDRRFVVGFPPELDIVVWIPKAASVSQTSELSQRIFDEAARRGLHLALATLPTRFFGALPAEMRVDSETVRCLRSVLMKPEHQPWLAQIWSLLDESATAALQPRCT